jgi:hypothetical protein
MFRQVGSSGTWVLIVLILFSVRCSQRVLPDMVVSSQDLIILNSATGNFVFIVLLTFLVLLPAWSGNDAAQALARRGVSDTAKLWFA